MELTKPDKLDRPFIGIQLKDGSKKFGRATKFTKFKIYVEDEYGDILDVPRRIISRALILIPGGTDNEPTEVSAEDKSSGGK